MPPPGSLKKDFASPVELDQPIDPNEPTYCVYFGDMIACDNENGAVESLLERSSCAQLADGSIVPIDEPCKQLLLLRHLDMSSKGLRCLGLAYNDELGELSDYYTESHPAHEKLLDHSFYSMIESGLIFVRVVGLRDPPCEEVHRAIKDCRGAGIKVMVITGDNKSTAEAICREIRLFSKDEDLQGKSFAGKEFVDLSCSQQILISCKILEGRFSLEPSLSTSKTL